MRNFESVAVQHMQRTYKKRTLKKIYEFSKMRDKKLESLRKVKAFYA